MSDQPASWRQGGARSYVLAYLAIATPLLLALCFLTAPFQVADEPSHFYRAIQISHGAVLPQIAPDKTGAGGGVERGAVELATRFKDPSTDVDRNRKLKTLSPSQIFDHLHDAQGAQAFTKFNNTVIYFPLAHIVPAAAIAVVRTGGASPIVWLYAGRIANALAALIISAFAIRLFRERALLPLIICLLPMTLFEEASLAVDALLIAFSLLLAAIVSRIAQGEPLSGRLNFLLFVSLVLVCVDKFAYIPLVVLPPGIAMLERQKRSDVARYWAISLATILIWLGWTFVVRHDVFPTNTEGHVSVGDQLTFVLGHPLDAAKILFGSMAADAVLISKEFVGVTLGWLDLLLPRVLVRTLLVVLVAAIFISRPLANIQLTSRVLTILVLAACVCAVYGLIYLQFTPVEAPRVLGVQGRYLIPLAPFAPLAWGGIGGAQALRSRGDLVLISLGALSALAAVIVVAQFYWRL